MLQIEMLRSAVLALLSVYIFNVYNVDGEAWSMSADSIGKSLYTMTSRATQSTSGKSHLACHARCMKRKTCHFCSSRYMPNVTLGRDNPYKCMLYLFNETDPYGKKMNCEFFNHPIILLPQALAGACADHKCKQTEICAPSEAGYWCKPAKRDRRKARAKAKKINYTAYFGR